MADFSVGDTVSVYTKDLKEKKSTPLVFTGTVIGFRGKGESRTFTVRKIGAGKVGIERIFPLVSPSTVKIIRKRKGKVRRAKLYYLRKQPTALKKILRKAKPTS